MFQVSLCPCPLQLLVLPKLRPVSRRCPSPQEEKAGNEPAVQSYQSAWRISYQTVKSVAMPSL